MVGSYQREAQHGRRSGQETIGRILMQERQFLRRGHNFVRQGSFAHIRGCRCDPLPRIAVQPDSSLGVQQQNFPCAHRGQPHLVVPILQFELYAAREPFRLRQAPNPNVGVKKKLQCFSASIESMSITGETTSPTISTLPDREPIQLLSSPALEAGTTSAIAFPRRVTRSGVFVLFTSSSSDRHLALNLEMAISRIGFFFPPLIAVLQRPL